MPRKTRPFGNEYHTICCGMSGVLFAMELVEGKDRPRELPSPPANRKTTKLLLKLCKSLAGTGKIVVLDCGLIGSVDCLRGELNNEPFNVYVMKEPEYTMKLMATYGSLTHYPNEKIQNRKLGDTNHQFQYSKPFSDHFKYRHIVDDHNNLRHSSPRFEDTWVTHRWPNRVFAFLLAVTGVNLFLWLRLKVWSKSNDGTRTLHQSRIQLAFALIDNKYIIRDEEERRVATRNVTDKDDQWISPKKSAPSRKVTNKSKTCQAKENTCSSDYNEPTSDTLVTDLNSDIGDQSPSPFLLDPVLQENK